jgi:hypothetical protein
LASDPPVPYLQIAEILDVPIGSLGPTRARCLQRLRQCEPLLAFLGLETTTALRRSVR